MIPLFDPSDGERGTLLATMVNLVWASVVIWGVTTELHGRFDGGHVAAVLLLAVAATGWLLWLASRLWGYHQLRLASWLIMAAAGGALSAFAPVGLVFVGVASLAAGMTWPANQAATITAVGPVVALVSAWGAGATLMMAVWATTAGLGGLTLGVARRQTQERAAQTAKTEVAEARADAEQARAELLAGRNHLAREMHDILAHTLSALSLQLEALDAVIEHGPEPALEVRKQLEGIRRLVREGLDDARGAVRALREDPPPLEDQLAKLSGDRHASLNVDGVPRRLAPDVSSGPVQGRPGGTHERGQARPRGHHRARPGLRRRPSPLGHPQRARARPDGSAQLAGSGAGYGLQGSGNGYCSSAAR